MRGNNAGIKTKTGGERERRPVVIRNRDIPLLTNVLPVMQMICKTEEMRQWQADRMTKITSNLTGMPGGKSQIGGFEQVLAVLSEIDDTHRQLCIEYTETLRKAENIINSIESMGMRAFVTMKYVMDVPDIEIRRELGMTLKRFYAARHCIEDAANMAGVKWNEKYTLRKEC